jgi:hypothetical protein
MDRDSLMGFQILNGVRKVAGLGGVGCRAPAGLSWWNT